MGDRDSEVLAAINCSLFEIQYTKGDFGSWPVYMDGGSGEVSYLPIITDGGRTAFAHPTLNRSPRRPITAPSERRAVVATMFIPTEGGAPGEAGDYSEFTPE